MEELNKKMISKKVKNLRHKRSRKSIKSDNLHVPLTPSTFRKIKTSSSRSSSTANSRSRFERLKFVELHDNEPLLRLSHAPPPSEVPKNVAVHFASFYQNQNPQTLPHSIGEKTSSGLENNATRNYPKMEFTRQMVYKLENSAGTMNYGRQVSALLDNTVEDPGFDLKLPPIDNCAPRNKPNGDYYPLWYRDPNKIPKISRQQFQDLKNKYDKTTNETIGRGSGKLEKPTYDSSGSEVELNEEIESDEDNPRRRYSSENCSLSSRQFSSEVETESEEEEEDDDSVDWETEVETEDSKIELKMANILQKNINKEYYEIKSSV